MNANYSAFAMVVCKSAQYRVTVGIKSPNSYLYPSQT